MTTSAVSAPAYSVAAPASLARVVPRWVRVWLWTMAGLVILMVVVGGATRLTGSGLSITQWRPIAGALPPLSQTDWVAEFSKYQESSQAQLLNAGMSLARFKHIFWWEWSHRQLGRFIGLVFAGGFLVGLLTRQLSWRVGAALAGMGALLGFQGVIGWVMVASGLKTGMTAVEPIDLAAHLLFASLFLVTLVALATSLGQNEAHSARAVPPRHAAQVCGLLLLFVLAQLVLGALVAGSHAGLLYNTWPDMDGRLVPPLAELFSASPWWTNPLENVTLIQFDHRMLAYAVLALALVNASLWRRAEAGGRARLPLILAGLVAAQAVLGIATLVNRVPLGLALAHQLLAMFVLVLTTRLWVLSRGAGDALGEVAGPLAARVATR